MSQIPKAGRRSLHYCSKENGELNWIYQISPAYSSQIQSNFLFIEFRLISISTMLLTSTFFMHKITLKTIIKIPRN